MLQNIKVSVGDIRSPLYQTHREMEFLLVRNYFNIIYILL